MNDLFKFNNVNLVSLFDVIAMYFLICRRLSGNNSEGNIKLLVDQQQ